MICRKKAFRISDQVAVGHCLGGYWLPVGLPEGARVTVLSIETSSVRVEFQGQSFVVSTACIQSGWEYRLNGKWHDEADPLITERLQKAGAGRR